MLKTLAAAVLVAATALSAPAFAAGNGPLTTSAKTVKVVKVKHAPALHHRAHHVTVKHVKRAKIAKATKRARIAKSLKHARHGHPARVVTVSNAHGGKTVARVVR